MYAYGFYRARGGPCASLTLATLLGRPRYKKTGVLPSSPVLATHFHKGKLSWVTLLTLVIALGVAVNTGNVLTLLQLLAAMQGLKQTVTTREAKRPRVKVTPPVSMAEHCKRGHMPQWSDCDTCCRARMRGPDSCLRSRSQSSSCSVGSWLCIELRHYWHSYGGH